MKLELITVGNKPPGWIREGVTEYQKRMPRECTLEIRDIALPKRTKHSEPEYCRKAEAQKIHSVRVAGARMVALDVEGKMWATEDLATKLTHWMAEYPLVQFVIGGPDGLDKTVIRDADDVWSLSRLTFPHALVPVLMAEQLYRAWTIITHHPYHR